MHAASTSSDSVRTSAYSRATSAKTRSQKAMLKPWAFDLVTDVTRRFLPRRRASSKANRMTLSVPWRVKTAVWTATSWAVPACTCPPTCAYSPSVFSRTTTTSMSPGFFPASGDRAPE